MKKFIICDLDGTVANLTHRLHYIADPGKKDWDNFFKNVYYDRPHHDILKLIDIFLSHDIEHDIVFVSGRPERTRQDTEDWLQTFGSVDEPKLYMRADGDRRADDIIKQEILDGFLKPAGITPETTLFVLDDRDRVVSMWRKNGFRVLQVAEGNF